MRRRWLSWEQAGEAMSLPKCACFLLGVGTGTVAGFGVEALDRNFNIKGIFTEGYQIPAGTEVKIVRLGFKRPERRNENVNSGCREGRRYWAG